MAIKVFIGLYTEEVLYQLFTRSPT